MEGIQHRGRYLLIAKEVRLWRIDQGDFLKELKKSKLDLEKRIESWLEYDISIISNELMVIGRQVETDFGGIIDLLCLDNNGDVAIVELKRDKTPREITAQALDYASWVKELDSDKIIEIANSYLRDKMTFEEAFKNKFGEDFPDIINERHKIIIVASEIDSSSERIIKYLSDSYGVGINAITFHYFQNEEGKEYLTRVYLIEPGEVEYKSRTKSSSKRLPPLTFDEFQNIAEKNGIRNIYMKGLNGFRQLFGQVTRHRNGIAFKGALGESKSRSSILVIYVTESNAEKGMLVNVYLDRLARYFDYDKETILNLLPALEERSEYSDGEEVGQFYFKAEEELDKVLGKLAEKQR